MKEDQTITKEEAIAAVTAASWAVPVESCGHRGCQEHLVDGERYVHSFLGGLGADHSLAGAIQTIREATQVGWSDHLLGHDLVAITADRKIYRYDVRRPVVEAAA